MTKQLKIKDKNFIFRNLKLHDINHEYFKLLGQLTYVDYDEISDEKNKEFFKGAQLVEDLGFVIGLHTKKIKIEVLKRINEALFSINKI